ncbi:N-(5'-phosphoribosyl)anthranilate isomerase [Litchfieldella qijiaojingensis]|uniref:N-(5'-phosphoribosyl)anthranilate isomerase n=1 Tax=Litchfieldella qijiaojingensis TaxID=980347 RepID=A0ABQ2Z8A8_9GAMM|nr:phosphoribosylanthranilate isomerase [Halomonas qijiaojingensis]GGY04585.1 N-(5'-phosphoribosyl)anthranilate isomerase [Halomonas qijiaojingensis]
MTRVKICCIGSVEEARLAVRLGASALGLVSEMPSGPGVIDEPLITEITASVPPPIGTFLLTSRTAVAQIVAQQQRCGVNTVQICDRLPPGSHAQLRRSLPGVSLVQVIHVTDQTSVSEARQVAPEVDALLLDSGNQSLPVKELGGTGRTHDWSLSARIAEVSPVPVFLAGGLNAENVGEAIATVRPFGVDICTGVRSDGKLDERKLRQFMEAVKDAAA